jgi:beta-N-acetylhexosaminidase
MKPLIVGLTGAVLTQWEQDFILTHKPYGFILFARNCISPQQVKELTESLKQVTERQILPILIDQEGGRVSRFKKDKGFKEYPPAGYFADLASIDLEVGITVNCTPMLDIRTCDSHEIIGDRAFGTTVHQVIALGKAQAQGLKEEGILSIIKHIPGHGRALADSHEELPIVTATESQLEQDILPFKACNDLPFAMTAHVIYTLWDKIHPATLSPFIIQKIIREKIGFQGILMSDDLSMKALKGSFTDRTKQALFAGCDVILHCNGNPSEMTEIADAIPFCSPEIEAFLQKPFCIKKW